ncbi:MAG: acetate--CoA ligase family protein, partial [Nitrospirae bacterium]|nr:acetate--CoA ligase family protein [Nitrospirota bacterium]
VSFRIAPVTRGDAREMIEEIKTSALLKGARGERPADMESITDAVLRLSAFVTDFPVVRELDINPLVVFEKGAIALDARIIFERK